MRKLIIAVIFLCGVSNAPAQNLVANGSFELPGLPPSELTRLLPDGDTTIPGWTVVDDGIGQRPIYAQRPNSDAVIQGNHGLILNQGSGIKATFRAQPGNFYELALWIRPGDCMQCVSPAPLRIRISGVSYLLPLVSGWSRQTVQFWVTNSVNSLEILNSSSPSDFKQFGVDDVSITKVQGTSLDIRFYPGVILEGIVGQHYEIQAATDLNAPVWQTLTNIFVTNAMPIIYFDADVKRPLDYPPKRRVYRAVQVPGSGSID